jgi:hypothetical protein
MIRPSHGSRWLTTGSRRVCARNQGLGPRLRPPLSFGRWTEVTIVSDVCSGRAPLGDQLVAARSRPKGTAAGGSLGKAPDRRPAGDAHAVQNQPSSDADPGRSRGVVCRRLAPTSSTEIPASNASSSAKPAMIKLIPSSVPVALPLAPASPNGGRDIRWRRPGGCGRGRLLRGGRRGLDIVRCRSGERISKARMRRYQNRGKSNCRESKTEHVTSPVGKCRKGFVLTNGECLEYRPISLKRFTP